MAALFSPLRLGALLLSHRVVMEPVGRPDARDVRRIPLVSSARYYAQRATAGGLIVAEACAVSPEDGGALGMAGLHSTDQVNQWSVATRAVHERDGLIVVPLWHGPSLPATARPAIGGGGLARKLGADEIDLLLKHFLRAAENAGDAGFDGVEIHASSESLAGRILRRPALVGSAERMAGVQLLSDLIATASAVWGPGRVGVRLSMGPPPATIVAASAVIESLLAQDVAYVDLERGELAMDAIAPLRALCSDRLIVSGGLDPLAAKAMIGRGLADAVGLGQPFVLEADLIERLRRGE